MVKFRGGEGDTRGLKNFKEEEMQRLNETGDVIKIQSNCNKFPICLKAQNSGFRKFKSKGGKKSHLKIKVLP